MRSSFVLAAFGAVISSSVVSARIVTRATQFGSCGSPAIIFANGLDGRTEPAFEPENLVDFNHGSALGIGVITSFICQQMNDKCHASATQIANCNAGATAAAALTGQAAADAFNAANGVTATGDVATTSNTATVAASTTTAAASTTTTAANDAVATTTTTGSTTTGTTDGAAPVNTGTLTFGTCTDPTVKFGAGLDGRKATEFSFLPNNQQQFPHGSALNPDIIFQFNCDTLVNLCGLKQTDTAVTTCRSAQQTADAIGRTGATADKFNELLGFSTNFAALDSQLSSTAANEAATTAATTTTAANLAAQTTTDVCSAGTTTVMVTVTAAPTTTAQNLAAQTTTSAEEDCSSKSKTKTKTKAKTTKTTAAVDSTSTSPAVLVATSVCVPTTVTATQMVTVTVGASTTAAATTTTAAENVATTAATTTSSGALPVNTAAHTGSLTFGTCTDPSVIFGPSFEGRQATDFSFLPNNRVQFNHDSAENPDIVFQAICDTLVNNCGLTETDSNVVACRAAEAAADQFGKTGKAADSFNAALGFATDFASLDSQLPASASTPITPSRTKRRSTGRTMRSNPKIVLKEMVNLARRTGVSRPAIARNADMTVRDDAAVGVAGIAEDFTPDW